MRYVICRMGDEETEAGEGATQELLDAMLAYNQELVEAGIMLDGDGLKPTSEGVRIEYAEDGGKTVVDGPFTESKEVLAGYTMIEVGSREEAIEWVKKWPTLDAHGNVELQLREVIEEDEFEQMLTPELKERHEQGKAGIAANRKKAGLD